MLAKFSSVYLIQHPCFYFIFAPRVQSPGYAVSDALISQILSLELLATKLLTSVVPKPLHRSLVKFQTVLLHRKLQDCRMAHTPRDPPLLDRVTVAHTRSPLEADVRDFNNPFMTNI